MSETPKSRLVDVRVNGATETDYSTIRIERRVANMVRRVAVLERRGKSLTSLFERMLLVYCKAEHPELTLVFDDREGSA